MIPLWKIFTKDQRAFYRDHAPAGLEFEALVPLGPTFILKAVFQPKELARRLVAEMWLYPDGSRILELSTKCLPAEAFTVSAGPRLPGGPGHRHHRRAADEDAHGPGLLRGRAPRAGGRERRVGAPGSGPRPPRPTPRRPTPSPRPRSEAVAAGSPAPARRVYCALPSTDRSLGAAVVRRGSLERTF